MFQNIKYMLNYDKNFINHFKYCFLHNNIHILPLNLLDKEYRYFGFEFTYYDGPHYSFGFWYFNITSSPKNETEVKSINSINFIKETKIIRFIKKIHCHIKNRIF